MERSIIIEKLQSQREQIIHTMRNHNTGYSKTNRKRPDRLDQSKHEEIDHMNASLIRRLETKCRAIESIISDLKNGWQLTCDSCGIQLTEAEVVEKLTVICDDCRREYVEEGKIVH